MYLNQIQYYYGLYSNIVYSIIIPIIQKTIGQGSGWILDSVIDHNINISLSWQQLYQITKRIRTSNKSLSNIQKIDDNEYFKWCLVRYLRPADRNPARITTGDKDFSK